MKHCHYKGRASNDRREKCLSIQRLQYLVTTLLSVTALGIHIYIIITHEPSQSSGINFTLFAKSSVSSFEGGAYTMCDPLSHLLRKKVGIKCDDEAVLKLSK